LREKDRKIVRVGAALLRIADGLDRSSSAVITDLRCRIGERKVDIVVKARGDAELEIWSARSRSRLFTKVFERTVGCQQE
jgi:exopolyphosphatase/guanosine-5'-triphosphate,3'-diphosphate pyrophosphatase